MHEQNNKLYTNKIEFYFLIDINIKTFCCNRLQSIPNTPYFIERFKSTQKFNNYMKTCSKKKNK